MRKKIQITTLIIILVMVAVCIVLHITTKEFPKKAIVNGVNIAKLTVEEANKKIGDFRNGKPIKLSFGSKTKKIKLSFKYDSKEALESLMKKASWNPIIKNNLKEGTTIGLKVIQGTLEGEIKLINKSIKDKTKDAHVDINKMKIKKEHYGKELDPNNVSEKIKLKLKTNPTIKKLKISKSSYKKPIIFKNDERLKKELEFDKKELMDGLKIKMPNNKEKVLTPYKYNQIKKYDYQTNKAKYSKNGAKKIALGIAKEYSEPIIKIKTKNGFKKIKNHGIGSVVDTKKTGESLYNAAKRNTIAKVITKVKGYDYHYNRIEVSIKKQKLYLIKNGKTKLTSKVVTGRPGHDTIKGAYPVLWKERNTILKGFEDDGSTYASKVSYWMPFSESGYGLHDATWRYSFGGKIYKYDGSHGCVNMPFEKAKKLFHSINTGYPVFIY